MKQNKLGHKTLLNLTFITILITASITGYININLGKITDYSIANDMTMLLDTTKIVIKTMGFFIIFSILEIFTKKLYLKKTMIQLKVNYVEELLHRSPLFFQKMKTSKIISNITSDADRLEEQYFNSIIEIMWTVARLIVSSFILIRIQPIFIIVILIMAIIFSYLANKSSKPIKKEEEKKSQSLTNYTSFITETLDGFEVIKQHKLRNEREKIFNQLTEDLKKNQYQVEKKTTLIDAFNSAIQFTIIISLIIVGIYSAQKFHMKIGTLMVVVFSFSDLIWPLQNMTPLITKLSGIMTVFKDYEKTLYEPKQETKQSVHEFESLEFENITLSYDKPILINVNFKINSKDKVLIVGPSGEGKSTILKAIMQELSIENGSIKLNQKSIDSYDLKSYFSLFASVHQKGFIFSDTVKNNITLLENEKIEGAMAKTYLSHLDLSLKLQNDGSNISGGERARLMLTRANHFNKPIIICDELFASLDVNIAKDIELDMLKTDQTLINVSHIIFKENLDLYDTYLIVDNQKVTVSKNKDDVLSRMLETDVLVQ